MPIVEGTGIAEGFLSASDFAVFPAEKFGLGGTAVDPIAFRLQLAPEGEGDGADDEEE